MTGLPVGVEAGEYRVCVIVSTIWKGQWLAPGPEVRTPPINMVDQQQPVQQPVVPDPFLFMIPCKSGTARRCSSRMA